MPPVSIFAVMIAGALLGCNPQGTDPSSDAPSDDLPATGQLSLEPPPRGRCPAYQGALDHLVGELLDDVRDQIPAEGDQFATRVPGRIYTQEYRRDRTLAFLDAEGRIEHVSCG